VGGGGVRLRVTHHGDRSIKVSPNASDALGVTEGVALNAQRGNHLSHQHLRPTRHFPELSILEAISAGTVASHLPKFWCIVSFFSPKNLGAVFFLFNSVLVFRFSENWHLCFPFSDGTPQDGTNFFIPFFWFFEWACPLASPLHPLQYPSPTERMIFFCPPIIGNPMKFLPHKPKNLYFLDLRYDQSYFCAVGRFRSRSGSRFIQPLRLQPAFAEDHPIRCPAILVDIFPPAFFAHAPEFKGFAWPCFPEFPFCRFSQHHTPSHLAFYPQFYRLAGDGVLIRGCPFVRWLIHYPS